MRSHLLEQKHHAPQAPIPTTDAPPPPTHRNEPTRHFDAFRSLLGTLLFLVLVSFLASASLVEAAERMEFGPERDRWLGTAEIVHDASSTLYLDQPGHWIRTLVQYSDGPGVEDQPDTVVLGDLAFDDQAFDDPALDDPAPDGAPEEPARIPVTSVPATTEAQPDDSTSEAVVPETIPEPVLEPEPLPVIPALREVTEADPLRVYLAGDSLGQFMAAHIAYRIAPPERTDIDIDYHISTGLARPDYFDWPARVTGAVAVEQRPEAVVYMVGGNDDQAMRLQEAVLEVSTPAWLEEYRRRVGLMMDITAYADTRMIWVLLPPMKSERREIISNQINAIVVDQASQRPWVSVIDVDDLLVGPDGNYSQFIDGPDGEQQLARQADGVHVTEIGSRWVADRVWAEISLLWPTVDAVAPTGDAETEQPDTTEVVRPPVSVDE